MVISPAKVDYHRRTIGRKFGKFGMIHCYHYWDHYTNLSLLHSIEIIFIIHSTPLIYKQWTGKIY